MARTLRIYYPDALYYLTNRGKECLLYRVKSLLLTTFSLPTILSIWLEHFAYTIPMLSIILLIAAKSASGFSETIRTDDNYPDTGGFDPIFAL
jgi:hypothetical protein